MYETRRHEASVSRTLSSPKRKVVQQVRVADNRKCPICAKKNVIQCNIWDYIGGGSSMLGGITALITGGRDSYNAIVDRSHTTYTITNSTITIDNATGTLEKVGNNDDNKYKVKVTGDIPNPQNQDENQDTTMPGATSRAVEGGCNALSGVLNAIAGGFSIAGSMAPAAFIYGAGALSSGIAAAIRYFRSRA